MIEILLWAAAIFVLSIMAIDAVTRWQARRQVRRIYDRVKEIEREVESRSAEAEK